ncbi:MAG: thiamine pyrophosphate-dependent enzyme [Candidatus Peribacteraceae bacterium]|nr:thiamine pyrophosphate-dependent enzyme [Candidatus Peribacteraceae bacterium]MDD5742246.1 thiamine pyrophosphate-dependent enzyme [Candidatus Peribacteraceae bacterium]
MKKSDSSAGPFMHDFASPNPCTWCDGCGDYGIWTAAKRALVTLKIAPSQVLLCYDVGCHGNMSDKIGGYRMHGLHGRVIPLAAGAALANPAIPVIAFGGDGASFSEGVGHLVHGIRSNYRMTFVMHNNANYGLTTGQASALTWQNQPMNSSPNGIPEETLNSMDFVFSLKPTFVARGWSGDIAQMTRILTAAIRHRGFAYVDMLQACPSYNKFATHEWLMQHCYDVNADPSTSLRAGGHDPKDFAKARSLAVDTQNRVATGILYQTEDVPAFHERLKAREGAVTTPVEEVKIVDTTQWERVFL